MPPQGGSPGPGEPAEKPRVTPRIAAEAAAWVARLHGPGRTREMELQCLAWQARSAAHRHAFERCTETWMEVPNAARAGGFPAGRLGRGDGDAGDAGGAGGVGRRRRGRWAGPAAVALVPLLLLVAAAIAWRVLDGAPDYRTAVGEAQTVLLDDGTRLSLNTSTQVQVLFDAAQRLVRLDHGEAVFEVARDTGRPFVVRAAGSEVVALGTVFSVRLVPPAPSAADAGAPSGMALAVTLVEGQVAVRAAQGGGAGGVAPPRPLVMQPGERVRLARAAAGVAAAPPQRDRPRLEQVLAWQRNEVVFDGVSLAEAVAEMNRYSRTPVVLAPELVLGPVPGGGRVSGQFRTGDNLAFAQALATLHGLRVQPREGRLELSQGPPPVR